jgi:vitamin B12 transporter
MSEHVWPFKALSLHASCVASTLFCTPAFADALDPIVVTASRSEQTVSQTGSSVAVVSADMIGKTASKGLADALRGVPGLEVREAAGIGSATSITIRGSAPGQTLVLIDGVRIGDSSAIDGSVDFGNLAAVDIERVEVLRGPQSALYGSDAMGGVINIITRKAEGSPRRSVAIEGGSYGTVHARASVSGSTDRLSYSFGIDGIHSDGFPRYGYRINRPLFMANGVTPLPPLPWGDPTNRGGATGRISYRLSDSATLEFGLSGFGNAIRFDNAFASIPSNVFSARNHSSATIVQGFSRLSWASMDGALKNQITVFGSLTDRMIAQTEACFDAFFTSFDCRNGFRGTRQGAEYQGDYSFGSSGVLTFGARTETETARTTQDPAPAGSFTPVSARQTTNSTFLQYRLPVGSRLDFSLGGRIDSVSAGPTFGTWRATASYRLEETGTRLHGSIGTGAKAPSLFQRFSQFGNARLSAEESIGGDFGIEQKFLDDRASIDITAFANRYRNLVGFGFALGCTAAQVFGCYYNVGRADTRGVEISANVVVVPEVWKARASYTYMSARDLVAGAPLLQRPRTQGSASVTYTGIPNLELEGRVIFVGPRLDFAFPPVRLGAYARFDAIASYRIDSRISLHARVENLTNARYEEIYNFGVAGRSIYGGVKVVW